MSFTIGIDTGGTFTDGFFVRGEQVETVKVPTTPHDLTLCFANCIKSGAERFGVLVEDLLYDTDIIRFSNTIGTSTIIQRDGSKIGLLLTKGRESLAPTGAEGDKAPLVKAEMVGSVEEKTADGGEVVKAPEERQVLNAAQALIDKGARCLVVALTNSDQNPANERLVRQVIKREYPRDFLGSVPVFLSSDISRRSGEGQRVNAAVLNAFIHAKLVRLLYKAGEDLRQKLYRKNLFIVHNNGSAARVAKTRAINTYNSGPAAGLLGARRIGELYGQENLISADMGGTSFDIGFVRGGQPSFTLKPDVEGFDVNLPMLAIKALGAGGGSIASVKDGKLKVGPQSAGALPGPVCFDLGGTEPTVADADLVLGILDPDYFLGGSMKLNLEKARAVIEKKIAEPLGISVAAAAHKIKTIIDEHMAQGIKGLESEFAEGLPSMMVVYGGAGPAHCCDIAAGAGVSKIVITPFSAVFSAFSSSSLDVGHFYYRRVAHQLKAGPELGSLAEAVAAMEKEAARDMRGEGFAADDVSSLLELYIKSTSGEEEVKVLADPDFYTSPAKVEAAANQARELLAAAGITKNGDLRLTSVSLLSLAAVPHYRMVEAKEAQSDVSGAQKGVRQVYLGSGKEREVPVFVREKMARGHSLDGPVMVESEQTTIFVPQGWRLTVDKFNNAVLEGV